MWKAVATVCVVLLVVISSDFAEAGRKNNKGQGQAGAAAAAGAVAGAGAGAGAGARAGAGRGKGAEVKDPNCSNWTFGTCQFKNGKTCGRGTKQGSRTGENCQEKTKQAPCFASCKQACDYNKGDWQACAAGKMTRTLTLKPGQPSTCEQTKTITKKCKAKASKASKATKAGATKGSKAGQTCKYSKKAPWSECANGKKTRTVTLKGRKPGCEPTKVETKNCKA